MRGAGNRGAALIQALVIAAALAGVGAALMLRTAGAVDRVQAHQDGAGLVLALDAGQGLLLQVIGALPPDGPTNEGAEWMQREGVELGGALLSWQVQDLGGRFDLVLLTSGQAEVIEVFGELTDAVNLSNTQAEALQQAAETRLGPRAPQALTVGDLIQGLALDDETHRRVMAEFAVLGGAPGVNINAISARALAARLPGLTASGISAVLERRAQTPFADLDDLDMWAQQALSDEDALVLTLEEWAMRSDWFGFTLTASLDSHSLSRSGVIRRGADAAATLVHAETGPTP